MKGWQKEYGVLLKFPKKQVFFLQTKFVLSEKRVIEKNIWTARLYILEKQGVDPPKAKYHFIGIKAFVKPLYRSKTKKTFVKEKSSLYLLKFVTMENVKLFPEFVFKGTGKRPEIEYK